MILSDKSQKVFKSYNSLTFWNELEIWIGASCFQFSRSEMVRLNHGPVYVKNRLSKIWVDRNFDFDRRLIFVRRIWVSVSQTIRDKNPLVSVIVYLYQQILLITGTCTIDNPVPTTNSDKCNRSVHSTCASVYCRHPTMSCLASC